MLFCIGKINGITPVKVKIQKVKCIIELLCKLYNA